MYKDVGMACQKVCKQGTAVCIDLAKCEPKSYAHEYNYVVNFFYRLNRKPNHIITLMCTAFWFTFFETAVIDFVVWASRVPILQGHRKQL